MLKEFKEFAMRGNVMDMAVGIVIGTAFGAIVKSLVGDLIMPAVGLFLGGADFTDLFIVLKEGTTPAPYATLAAAQEAGAVTVNTGVFVNTIINFVIVALALFFVIRSMNRLKSKKETPAAKPTTKDCNFCLSTIPIKATRCPQCTSQLTA